MVTSKINGVTKFNIGEVNFVYYFATCIVNVSGDEIQYLWFNNEVPFRFKFESVSEKYGTMTAEEYVDYLAANDFFTAPVVALDKANKTIGTGTYYSDFELRAIDLLGEIRDIQKELLFFIKSIAE